MDLKESMDLFARLSVDKGFREATLGDPGGVAKAFSEIEADVRRNARGLFRKRMNAVRGVLPGTCGWLERRFEDEFRAYARRQPAIHGPNRHQRDAAAFAEWLAFRTKSGRYPPALRELAIHEATPATMWLGKRRLLLRFHWRSPWRIREMLKAGMDLSAVATEPTVVIWSARSLARGGVRWREFRF